LRKEAADVIVLMPPLANNAEHLNTIIAAAERELRIL
jgi:adenosylmethionine-8-amino-7-oxononanoate aminotransferase